MADWANKLALIAGGVSALTLGAGVTAVLWSWRKSNKDGNAYETERLVNQYMAFHYAPADEYFAFDIGPKEDVDFPKRCAELCVRHKKVRKVCITARCSRGRAFCAPTPTYCPQPAPVAATPCSDAGTPMKTALTRTDILHGDCQFTANLLLCAMD